MRTARHARSFDEPACTIAGVHFDGNTVLNNPSLVADLADTSVAFSYWLKTERVLDITAFYEIAIGNPDTTGSTVPNTWLYQRPGLPSGNFAAEAGTQWSPITQGSQIAVNYPGGGSDLTGQDDQWMHVLVQLYSAGANRPGAILVNGIQYNVTNEVDLGADSTTGLADLPFWVGGSGQDTAIDGSYLVGDMAEFWMASGADILEVDGTFSDATVAKFRGANNTPVFLGDQGQLPLGEQSTIYLHRCAEEDVSTFYDNRGSGGAFTLARGSLTASATNPPGDGPMPTRFISVTGATPVGSLLTLDGNVWSNSPVLTYQWQNDGGDIVGANAATYTTQGGDLGNFIICIITAVANGKTTVISTAYNGTTDGGYFGPVT